MVAKSPPDGYTLLVCAGTITINHIMYKKLPYDVLRDLAPITQLVSLPNVLVVHPSQPFKTLAEFIAAAKAKPGQINFASAGVGSNLHLSMELLEGHDRHRRRARAVQGRRSGDVRPAGRARRLHGVQRGVGQAACRQRASCVRSA